MELPEAQIVCEQLQKSLNSKVIGNLIVKTASVLQNPSHHKIIGKKIGGFKRVGKVIYGKLLNGPSLIFRFGMTGQLWLVAKNVPLQKHTHLIFEFEGESKQLRYRDIRKFGKIIISDQKETGTDFFDLSADKFCQIIREHKAPIKNVLLNHKVAAGIGNIYSDEALFAARIHPKKFCSKIDKESLILLHTKLSEIFTQAIKAGGSTISDFVDLFGKPGNFKNQHKVYGRYNKPCLVCGTKLRRITAPSRSYTFCPTCQTR